MDKVLWGLGLIYVLGGLVIGGFIYSLSTAFGAIPEDLGGRVKFYGKVIGVGLIWPVYVIAAALWWLYDKLED